MMNSTAEKKFKFFLLEVDNHQKVKQKEVSKLNLLSYQSINPLIMYIQVNCISHDN
jgi:hypothetical protein